MPRARNIKPAFFANDDLAECDALARLLFAGLWCLCDRNGVLLDRPRRIKAELLPYDDCDIDDLLGQLSERGFIVRYVADGDSYVFIPKFGKHQKPHKNEQKLHPLPDDESPNRKKIRSTREKKRAIQTKKATAREKTPSDRAECLMLNAERGMLKEESRVREKTRSRQSSFEPRSVELPFESDSFREAWSDWIRHRHEIRKPLTETSVKQQLRRLSELGERAAMEMLRHTVEKGWTGLRAPERPAKGREAAIAASKNRRGTL